MTNTVKRNKEQETLMIMPIRETFPDKDSGVMNGNMFVAFTKKDNKIVFQTPQVLDLSLEALKGIKLEPLAIGSFIVEGFTLEDVFSVAPIFGNITPPELVKTPELQKEFTTVVMNGTDGRMATYLIKSPLENEEVYLGILDFKIKADIVEDPTKLSEDLQNFVVTLDYENLDMDISLQSISKLKTVDGNLIIPEENGVPQQVEFAEADSLDKIVLEDEPTELQDLLDSAMKLYFGSANEDINRQLVDFYYLYIIAKEASYELTSIREGL